MNYSDALYFVFAMYAAKYGGGVGGAFGNHVLLLTSRKFSLMTSRGNSCSMVTNNDDPRIVRPMSMRLPKGGGNGGGGGRKQKNPRLLHVGGLRHLLGEGRVSTHGG